MGDRPLRRALVLVLTAIVAPRQKITGPGRMRDFIAKPFSLHYSKTRVKAIHEIGSGIFDLNQPIF